MLLGVSQESKPKGSKKTSKIAMKKAITTAMTMPKAKSHNKKIINKKTASGNNNSFKSL